MTAMTRIRIEKPVTMPAIRPMGKVWALLLLLMMLAAAGFAEGDGTDAVVRGMFTRGMSLLDWLATTVMMLEGARLVMKSLCDVEVGLMGAKVVVMLEVAPTGGAPIEITTVGIEDVMAYFDDGETVAEVCDAGARLVVVVVELGSWLISGHVTPSAQGLMEQHPSKAFSEHKYQMNPSGHSSIFWS